MNHYAIRDEYAPTFGRQNLTLWSGAFASTFEGYAHELPGHDGYMVHLDYFRGSVRVECESPRTDDNHMRVDDAINSAINSAEALASFQGETVATLHRERRQS